MVDGDENNWVKINNENEICCIVSISVQIKNYKQVITWSLYQEYSFTCIYEISILAHFHNG